MTNSIQIFTTETVLVSYANKKGDQLSISTEGALFKGGEALKSLKCAAMLSAYNKAESGRYRAATDILSAAFPALTKAFDKFVGTPAWQSKTTMALFLDKLEALRPTNEAKGFSKKQLEARGFIQSLRTINALVKTEGNAFTIEA